VKKTGKKHTLDSFMLTRAASGDVEWVRDLIAEGVDVNAADEHGWTALLFAARDGRLPMAEYLLGEGARLDVRNSSGGQPVHLAAAWNRLSVLEFLVQKGARIDAVDDDGWTPLHHTNHLPMVEFLLEAGADPAAKAKDGRTPMDLAEDPEILALLKKWSDPEFLEKRRQAENAKAIRDHWARVGKRACPRPGPRL